MDKYDLEKSLEGLVERGEEVPKSLLEELSFYPFYFGMFCAFLIKKGHVLSDEIIKFLRLYDRDSVISVISHLLKDGYEVPGYILDLLDTPHFAQRGVRVYLDYNRNPPKKLFDLVVRDSFSIFFVIEDYLKAKKDIPTFLIKELERDDDLTSDLVLKVYQEYPDRFLEITDKVFDISVSSLSLVVAKFLRLRSDVPKRVVKYFKYLNKSKLWLVTKLYLEKNATVPYIVFRRAFFLGNLSEILLEVFRKYRGFPKYVWEFLLSNRRYFPDICKLNIDFDVSKVYSELSLDLRPSFIYLLFYWDALDTSGKVWLS